MSSAQEEKMLNVDITPPERIGQLIFNSQVVTFDNHRM